MSNSGGIGIKNTTFWPRGPSSAAALIRLLDSGKLHCVESQKPCVIPYSYWVQAHGGTVLAVLLKQLINTEI